MDRNRVALFDEIYGTHNQAVYRYLWYLTRDRNDTDDLFQETWLRVVKKMDQITDVRKIKSWLYTIATNLYRDHLRRKKVRHSFLESKIESHPDTDHVPIRTTADPVEDLQRREATEAVFGAMERLPAKMRQVFILREIEGLSYDEIGRLLKLASGTAKSRMHRAIRRMRQDLASRFDVSDFSLGEIS